MVNIKDMQEKRFPRTCFHANIIFNELRKIIGMFSLNNANPLYEFEIIMIYYYDLLFFSLHVIILSIYLIH